MVIRGCSAGGGSAEAADREAKGVCDADVSAEPVVEEAEPGEWAVGDAGPGRRSASTWGACRSTSADDAR
jgi:hypothetical protein